MVAPVLAAVVAFETRRTPELPATDRTWMTLAGGLGLFVGLGAALWFGAQTGAIIGLVAVLFLLQILRRREQVTPAADAERPSTPDARN